MKKLPPSTAAHQRIKDYCDSDKKTVIEGELEISLSGTGPTVEEAILFNLYRH